MQSNVEPGFIMTKDNIKFPSFPNKDFIKSVNKPIDNSIIAKDFDLLLTEITGLLSNIYNVISKNVNEFNLFSMSYGKLTLRYYFLLKAFYRMTIAIKQKLLSEDIPNKTPQISDVISEFYNDKFINKLIKIQYSENSKEKVKNEFSLIFDHEIEILNSENVPAKLIVNMAIKFSIDVFKTITSQLEKFKSIKKFRDTNEERFQRNEIILFDVLLALEKIIPLDLCLHNSFFVDKDDIFNLPEDGDEWKKLKNYFIRIKLDDESYIINEKIKVAKMMGISNSIIVQGFTSSSTFLNVISSVKLAFKYKNNEMKAEYDAKKYSLESKRGNMIMVTLEIMKNPLVKALTKRNFEKINYWRKIYLKREEREITEDVLKEILDNLKKEKFTIIKDLPKGNANANIPNAPYLEIIQKKDKKYYVSTRLLHTSKITFPGDEKGFFDNLFDIQIPPNTTRDALLIHIHGGGFMATTTFNHERYLRGWVNHFNIPLIGINYGLSPQNKYPKALDDIWQAYNWIIKHSKDLLGIDPKIVIVSGDSAGGNLVLALTYLIIATERRIPDLVLAEYPCCDTSVHSISPSMFLCLDDFLLNFPLLKLCNEAYRSNYTNDMDPFLNPDKAPDCILKKMPRTLFFIGTSDPLRDGTIRLMYKMSKLDLDFKGYEFKEYMHGFYGLESEILRKIPTKFLFDEVDKFMKEHNK